MGGEGGGGGVGSWVASTIPASRIGTMNPIVLVLVLVLVLETKLAGRGRVRERGRGRRDGSWRAGLVRRSKVDVGCSMFVPGLARLHSGMSSGRTSIHSS